MKPEVADAPADEGKELVADKDTSNEKFKDKVIKQLTKERSGDEPAQSAKKKKIEIEEGDRLWIKCDINIYHYVLLSIDD